MSRIYAPAGSDHGEIRLAQTESHYLSHVLRLGKGSLVQVFDGCGTEWETRIRELTRRGATLEIIAAMPAPPMPSFDLTLVQALVKSDAMDLIVQKSTELGVTHLRPVSTEHGVVNLDAERASRRLSHWQKIARSACEQSGRHWLPNIDEPVPLAECLDKLIGTDLIIALDPRAEMSGDELQQSPARLAAVVGPEGGFSHTEIDMLDAAGCVRLRFGPRILRAETAAIIVAGYAQRRWGDLR